jgi:hypothetical protein
LCLIFHVFLFFLHIPGPSMCISHFSRFSVFLNIFHILQCAFLIFHVFECFSPYSRSYSVCFSFCTFFSVFLAIFHVLPCEFLIFLVCPFSRHILGPTLCVSHFPHISVFSPQSSSYSVCFSFSTFSVFLTIFQVLSCEFLIFFL